MNRKQLLQLINVGIDAVLPSNVMPAVLSYDKKKKILRVISPRLIRLPQTGIIHKKTRRKNNQYRIKGRIFVIGGGKAAGLMAETLEKIIPITDGVVNCVSNKYKTKKIKIIKAGHPIPNQAGVEGVKKMLNLKEKHKIDQDDLVIALISGGGSALMPYPADGINLADKQKITKQLIASGADIKKINQVRKRLSKIKGGKLAQHFAPTKIVSLIISDVAGNNLRTIASGPTVADNADNYIIADNLSALKAIQKKVKAKIIIDGLVGDTEQVAKKIARDIMAGRYKAKMIMFGGETTPTLPKKHGQGGRNMHFAAVTMMALKGYKKNWLMASIASDGADFMAGIGGAIVDNQSLIALSKNKIDIDKYISNFDSFNLLKKVPNCLIKTANSGTNVGDIIIYLINN